MPTLWIPSTLITVMMKGMKAFVRVTTGRGEERNESDNKKVEYADRPGNYCLFLKRLKDG